MTVDLHQIVKQLVENYRQELEDGLHYTTLAIILGRSPTYARELAQGLGGLKDFEYKKGKLYYKPNSVRLSGVCDWKKESEKKIEINKPILAPVKTKTETAVVSYIRDFYVQNYLYLIDFPRVVIDFDFLKELRRIYRSYNRHFSIQHLKDIVEANFNGYVSVEPFKDKYGIQTHIMSFPSVTNDLDDIVQEMFKWWEKEGYAKTEFNDDEGMGTTKFTKEEVPLNLDLIQFKRCKVVGGGSLEKRLRLAYELTLKELGYLKSVNILHIPKDDLPLIYPPEEEKSERIYDIFVRKVTLGRHGLQYFENIGNILVWRHGTIQPFEG